MPKLDTKISKTAAERKAAERQRRKEAGQVLVQEWVSKENAERVKKYIARVMRASIKKERND